MRLLPRARARGRGQARPKGDAEGLQALGQDERPHGGAQETAARDPRRIARFDEPLQRYLTAPGSGLYLNWIAVNLGTAGALSLLVADAPHAGPVFVPSWNS